MMQNGGGQNEIDSFKADQREAYHESRGTKENRGCAAEEVGAREGEDRQLTRRRTRLYFWS